MPRLHTVYITKEQAQRLAAISCDTLVGIQFDTDASDKSAVHGCYVPIDDPHGSDLRFFTIEADGSYTDRT